MRLSRLREDFGLVFLIVWVIFRLISKAAKKSTNTSNVDNILEQEAKLKLQVFYVFGVFIVIFSTSVFCNYPSVRCT